MILALALIAFLHNPFHHKPPAPVLTMDSDIPGEGKLSRVEEYIYAYQAVRDSLPRFMKDERNLELEGEEIAAVQADLNELEKVTDPVHDPLLPKLSDKLAADATALVDKEDSFRELDYVSYHKPKVDPQWKIDLNYVHGELQRKHATQSTDPWFTESEQAYHRAVADREDYLAGAAVSAERVTNDITEARFDLNCIGKDQSCGFGREGN